MPLIIDQDLYSFAYYFSPIIILLFGAIVVALITLVKKIMLAKTLSYIFMLFSLSLSFYFLSRNVEVLFFNNLISVDNFSIVSWIALIVGAIISLSALSEELLKREAQPLLLLSLAASLIAVSTRDLILLFLAVEASVFPAYVLVAQFKRDYFSLEATVKFFIFGVLSTLFFAYGLAIIYGIAGGTSFISLYSFFENGLLGSEKSFVILGILLIIASLGIKSTLVPLHVWAIDAYQGSPTSIAAYLSSTAKLTGIIAIALLLSTAFKPIFYLEPWFRYILAFLALITMVVPNIIALVQRNIKRLLAYSSVAHAGYMALVFVFPSETLPLLGFYVLTYSIAKAISFLVANRITGEGSESPYDKLLSLFRIDPLAATTFTVALLSLAGIPPFAGFMAKFLLFLNVAFSSILGVYLALVALIMSGISVYYYAYLIRLEVITETNSSLKTNKTLETDIIMIISIIALLLLTFFPSYFYYQKILF
jgi:NADH-quinone oxidoreductase subunit N